MLSFSWFILNNIIREKSIKNSGKKLNEKRQQINTDKNKKIQKRTQTLLLSHESARRNALVNVWLAKEIFV